MRPKLSSAMAQFPCVKSRERVWHDSQVITEKPDGRIELEMRRNFPDEAIRWALSWGERARVLAPADMVERMRERECERWARFTAAKFLARR